MRNQIFHSPGNEEAELAKIPGDGDPPPPHWDLYFHLTFTFSIRLQNLPNKFITNNFKASPLEKKYGNFFSSNEEENQFCQEILTFVENNNERSFDTNNPIQSVSK